MGTCPKCKNADRYVFQLPEPVSNGEVLFEAKFKCIACGHIEVSITEDNE